jgi:hypothetical protein
MKAKHLSVSSLSLIAVINLSHFGCVSLAEPNDSHVTAAIEPTEEDRLEVGLAFVARNEGYFVDMLPSMRNLSVVPADACAAAPALRPATEERINDGTTQFDDHWWSTGWTFDGTQCVALSPTRSCVGGECAAWSTLASCQLARQVCELQPAPKSTPRRRSRGGPFVSKPSHASLTAKQASAT